MLQQHPFFSSPFIFYGTQQETELENLVFQNKTPFTQLHTSFKDSLTPSHIGLYFLWDEENEEENIH